MLAFMFLPCILALMFESFYSRDMKTTITRALSHLPFFQIVRQCNYVKAVCKEMDNKTDCKNRLEQKENELRRMTRRMYQNREERPRIAFIREELAGLKTDLDEASERLLEAKSKLHEFRVYEAYGESFPQLVLQTTVMIKEQSLAGVFNNILETVQMLSSFANLTRTSSEMIQSLPIFVNERKRILSVEGFGIYILTLLVEVPRLLALSLIFSRYTADTNGLICFTMVFCGILLFGALTLVSLKSRRKHKGEERKYLWLTFLTSFLTPGTMNNLKPNTSPIWNLYMYLSVNSSMIYSSMCFAELYIHYATSTALENWMFGGLIVWILLVSNLASFGISFLSWKRNAGNYIEWAFESEDYDTLTEICQSNFWIDLPESDILIKALMDKNIDVTKRILTAKKKRLDLNAVNEFDENALVLAIQNGFDDVCSCLIQKEGLNLSKEMLSVCHGHQGRNILMLASMHNCRSVVQYILELEDHNKPNINATDYEGNTALMLAYHYKHKDIFRLLESKLGLRVEGLFIAACGKGDIHLMQTIIDEVDEEEDGDEVDNPSIWNVSMIRNVDINFKQQGYTPLMTAVRNRHLDAVKLLMEQPSLEPNIKGGPHNSTTALMIAFSNNHLDVALKMLEMDSTRKLLDVNIPENRGQTVLIKACMLNDVDIVYRLLKYPNIQVNAKNKNGETAFEIAFFKGFWTMVDLLRKAGAQSDITDLMIASRFGDDAIQIRRLLVELPNNEINATTKNGKTALMLACYFGHKSVVDAFIQVAILRRNYKKQINFEAVNGNGNSAFMIACMSGHPGIVLSLMNNATALNLQIERKNIQGCTAFMLACAYGHTTVVQMFLEKAKTLNIDLFNTTDRWGQNALKTALSNDHKSVVEMLSLNTPWGEDGNTVLIEACIVNDIQKVTNLMDYPCIDVNAKNRNQDTAFDIAFSSGFKDLVDLLRRRSESSHITDLMIASRFGDTAQVKLLLSSRRPKLNETTKNGGKTALMLACEFGNADVVNAFLEEALKRKRRNTVIQLDTIDENGNSGFMVACQSNHPLIVSSFLRHAKTLNIKLDRKNSHGRTAFIMACAFGHQEVVQVILDQAKKLKIDLDTTDNLGQTGFISACMNRHKSVAEMLVKNSEKIHINLDEQWLQQLQNLDSNN